MDMKDILWTIVAGTFGVMVFIAFIYFLIAATGLLIIIGVIAGIGWLLTGGQT